jgi:hypothetical protein
VIEMTTIEDAIAFIEGAEIGELVKVSDALWKALGKQAPEVEPLWRALGAHAAQGAAPNPKARLETPPRENPSPQ